MNRAPLLCLLSFALGAAACSDDKIVGKPPYFAASTDLIDFGEVQLGDTEVRTVFFINKGELPMRFDPPSGILLGTVFTLVGMEDLVDPGASITVRVFFNPEFEGPVQDVLEFPNDSPNEPVFKLTLQGTGLERDPCRDLGCNTPPPRYCVSSTVSRGFDPIGQCADGECRFQPLDETCSAEWGCDPTTGFCRGDPCQGVACQTPPNSCFHGQGRCEQGACIYTVNDGAACDDGNVCTENDVCQSGSCRGTNRTCNRALQPECADANTLRRWESAGFCNQSASGQCTFAEPTTVTCQFGCETANVNGVAQGRCKGDPCAHPYDDGNPCTEEYCDATGWHSRPKNGADCLTGDQRCTRGVCSAGACLPKAGESCTAEVDLDLCGEEDVPGTCQGDGRCLPNANPNDPCHLECPGSPFCAVCSIGFGFKLTICL